MKKSKWNPYNVDITVSDMRQLAKFFKIVKNYIKMINLLKQTNKQMKEVNFRIIELPTHQVLITKDWDEDEDSSPLLTVTFFLEGIKVNQKLGYSEEETRDKAFIDFTDKNAQSMLDSALEMFNEQLNDY